MLKKTLVVAALLSLVGCAAAQHVSRGDDLLKQGKYQEAIASYENALRLSPGHSSAQEGIRRARRESVADELGKAKQALTKGDYAGALVLALRARRMPLDLDEVALAQDIDNTISMASRRAEEQVRQWGEKGLYLLAVELADQVVRASPGVESRSRWAEDVRAKAGEHFQALAKELQSKGLIGSAAMQLAMAKQVGADVAVTEVAGLWDKFTEPVCFAEPSVSVTDVNRQLGDLQGVVATAAKAELDSLRARCGEGTRPLGVTIEVTAAKVVDETTKEQAAKALPGSNIETVEVYYDERPYTVEEEYTEHEKRIEKQERRDCAPRPGQPRGCRTWVEDVEVTVPIKRNRKVTKVERIKRTRPAKGPFPPDKVVTYEITSVERRVQLQGTINIAGAPGAAVPFVVDVESRDKGNQEVNHPRMLIKADPLEAKPMPEVIGEAAAKLTADLRAAVAAAVKAWSEEDAKQARDKAAEGARAEAEELYLRQIALGDTEDTDVNAFFQDRYGKPVGAVISYLLEALGQDVARRRPGQEDVVQSFPRRGTAGEGTGSAAAEAAERAARAVVEQDAPQEEAKPDVTQMQDDELKALEEASFAAGQPGQPEEPETAPQNGASSTGEGGAAEPSDDAATPAQDDTGSSRAPISPKS